MYNNIGDNDKLLQINKYIERNIKIEEDRKIYLLLYLAKSNVFIPFDIIDDFKSFLYNKN